MMVVGAIVLFGLALVGIAFAALLLVSGWNALGEELSPGFRSHPPDVRSLALTLLGFIVPVLLIVAFTAYFAIWLLRMMLVAGA